MKLDVMIRELMLAREIAGGDVEVVFQEDKTCSRILDCPSLRDVVVLDEDSVRLADDTDSQKVQMLIFR